MTSKYEFEFSLNGVEWLTGYVWNYWSKDTPFRFVRIRYGEDCVSHIVEMKGHMTPWAFEIHTRDIDIEVLHHFFSSNRLMGDDA